MKTMARRAIIAFVEKVTKAGSPDFVPAPERIATFDHDGTLWTEQPRYAQLRFALDQVKALAPQHPEWKKKQPFKKLPTTPMQEAAVAEQELVEIGMAARAGITTDTVGIQQHIGRPTQRRVWQFQWRPGNAPAARVSRLSSITPTLNANEPTTASRASANSIRLSTKLF